MHNLKAIGKVWKKTLLGGSLAFVAIAAPAISTSTVVNRVFIDLSQSYSDLGFKAGEGCWVSASATLLPFVGEVLSIHSADCSSAVRWDGPIIEAVRVVGRLERSRLTVAYGDWVCNPEEACPPLELGFISAPTEGCEPYLAYTKVYLHLPFRIVDLPLVGTGRPILADDDGSPQTTCQRHPHDTEFERQGYPGEEFDSNLEWVDLSKSDSYFQPGQGCLLYAGKHEYDFESLAGGMLTAVYGLHFADCSSTNDAVQGPKVSVVWVSGWLSRNGIMPFTWEWEDAWGPRAGNEWVCTYSGDINQPCPGLTGEGLFTGWTHTVGSTGGLWRAHTDGWVQTLQGNKKHVGTTDSPAVSPILFQEYARGTRWGWAGWDPENVNMWAIAQCGQYNWGCWPGPPGPTWQEVAFRLQDLPVTDGLVGTTGRIRVTVACEICSGVSWAPNPLYIQLLSDSGAGPSMLADGPTYAWYQHKEDSVTLLSGLPIGFTEGVIRIRTNFMLGGNWGRQNLELKRIEWLPEAEPATASLSTGGALLASPARTAPSDEPITIFSAENRLRSDGFASAGPAYYEGVAPNLFTVGSTAEPGADGNVTAYFKLEDAVGTDDERGEFRVLVSNQDASSGGSGVYVTLGSGKTGPYGVEKRSIVTGDGDPVEIGAGETQWVTAPASFYHDGTFRLVIDGDATIICEDGSYPNAEYRTSLYLSRIQYQPEGGEWGSLFDVAEFFPGMNIQPTSGRGSVPVPECPVPTPTPTPEWSPTPTETATAEITLTPTPEVTPTADATSTPEESPTPEYSPTPEWSPTPMETATPAATATFETPTATPDTPTPTPVPPTPTPTPTATPTLTATPIPGPSVLTGVDQAELECDEASFAWVNESTFDMTLPAQSEVCEDVYRLVVFRLQQTQTIGDRSYKLHVKLMFVSGPKASFEWEGRVTAGQQSGWSGYTPDYFNVATLPSLQVIKNGQSQETVGQSCPSCVFPGTQQDGYFTLLIGNFGRIVAGTYRFQIVSIVAEDASSGAMIPLFP